MICPNCRATNADGATFCNDCGQFLGSLAPGEIIGGRHEIVRFLGKGGMGSVYEARDRTLDEPIALKVLRPNPSDADDLARRFRSEIKLARKVRHPNVCGIHEYGQDGRLQYISMELIEGQDLKSIIRERGPLSQDEVYDTAIQIAEGLEAVHKQGIVHRDLKTSNIMRDRHGLIRLMDFGIARQVTSDGTDMTATGVVVGTPEYMSPEQARGVKVDQRSDIYSFGIVLYEVCTGQVPFQGETPVATILKHLHEPAPLDAERMGGFAQPLIEVLYRTLAKEPDQRYRSMSEVLAALRAARPAPAAETPAPRPVPAPSEPAPPPTRVVSPPPPTPAPTVVTPVHPMPSATRPAPSTRPVPRPLAAARAQRRLALWLGAAAILVSVVAGSLLVVPAFQRAAEEGPAATPSPDPPATLPAPPPVETPAAVASNQGTPGERSVRPEARPSSSRGAATAAVVADEPAPRPATERSRQQPATEAPGAQPARPTPIPVTLSPRPSSTPSPTTPAPHGWLRVVVSPWAEVRVDGEKIGTTPLEAPLELSVGKHALGLEHPDYFPLNREVTVQAGETTRVEIDLTWEGFKKQ